MTPWPGIRRPVGRWLPALAVLVVDPPWAQVPPIPGTAVVGRPHLARAMVDSGAITEPSQAFSRDWIGAGGRPSLDRYALDPVRALGLVRAAGGSGGLDS